MGDLKDLFEMCTLTEALLLALESAGSNKPAKIAMIAITTSNSIRVNPFFFGQILLIFQEGLLGH